MIKMLVTVGLAGGLLACLPTLVLAGDAPAEVADMRAPLESRKLQQAALFDAQERACAKVFAVTDCVNEVNARRRTVMAALRKEENALNDADRRQRERERLQSLQEKARQRAEQAPSPADPGAESSEERLRRQHDKLTHHAPQSTPKVPTVPKVQAQIDAQTQQQNAAAYAARQKAASDRRAERDKKLKEQGNAPKDLPTPP